MKICKLFCMNINNHKQKDYLGKVSRETIDRIFTSIIYELAIKNRCIEPKISAAILSKEFGVSNRIFSAVINLRFNTTFNNVLNHYRILQVTYMMKDSRYDELSCNSIGEACGFSNNMTFATAFKKEIGETPATFRSSVRPI